MSVYISDVFERVINASSNYFLTEKQELIKYNILRSHACIYAPMDWNMLISKELPG